MAMGEFKWMEKRVNELKTLSKERLYTCLYNMKRREYRNRKTFALDNIGIVLVMIVAQPLEQL